MSAPLFLVPALPATGAFVLDGPEGRHAATVQRLRVGESLLLSDGRGGLAPAEVTRVDNAALVLAVGSATFSPAPEPRIVVAQGLAKGDRGELAVQTMTEVGVDEIVPWSAARSIVHWRGERAEKSWQRWESTIREATKQSRRPWLPVLAPLASTATLTPRVTMVMHEAATARLGAVDLPTSGDIVLVVGPEGGVADEELAAFTAAGAVAVRLGSSVLRTSTAGAAAVAALSIRLGRW